jgi:hypothetical protein
MTSLVVSGRHPLARARQAKGRQGGAHGATNRPRPGLRWRRDHASGSRPIRNRSARSPASRSSFFTRRYSYAFTPNRCARCTTSPSAVIRTTDRRRCRSIPTNCRPAYASISGVVPGTGFEPVCLSAARFKFDLTRCSTVREGPLQSRIQPAALSWLSTNDGELQPLVQPQHGDDWRLRTSGQPTTHGKSRLFDRDTRNITPRIRCRTGVLGCRHVDCQWGREADPIGG